MESVWDSLSQLRHNPPEAYKEADIGVYAEAIVSFLQEWNWIYSMNYITSEFLDAQVPAELKAGLLSFNEEQTRALASFPDSEASLLPSSLAGFLDGITKLSMPSHYPRNDIVSGTPDDSKMVTLEGAFTQGMKEKKQHEVSQLATLISTVNTDYSPTPVIVDVGAGKGWVGQVLTYKLGMNVINLEGNPCHNDEASNRSIEVQRRLHNQRQRKLRSEGSPQTPFVQRPTFNAHYFLDFGIDVGKFDGIISSAIEKIHQFDEHTLREPIAEIKKKEGRWEGEEGERIPKRQKTDAEKDASRHDEDKACLICLHGCGDLSASVLYTFAKWPQCATLVSVGCCYHKLSITEIKQNERSFQNLFNLLSPITACVSNSGNDLLVFHESTRKRRDKEQETVKKEQLSFTEKGSEYYQRYYGAETTTQHIPKLSTHQENQAEDGEQTQKEHQQYTNTQKVFPMSRCFSMLFLKYDLGNLDGLLQLATKCAFGFQGITSEGLKIKGSFLYYRALMEIIFRKYFAPHGITWYIRRMKSMQKGKDFETYLVHALDNNLRLDFHPEGLGDACRPEEIIDNWVDMRENVLKPKLRKLYQKKLPYLQFVNPFMAMECALSRVIESLLLLDRYAFLDEQGNIDAAVVPIFNKEESPRNLAIIARKKK